MWIGTLRRIFTNWASPLLLTSKVRVEPLCSIVFLSEFVAVSGCQKDPYSYFFKGRFRTVLYIHFEITVSFATVHFSGSVVAVRQA